MQDLNPIYLRELKHTDWKDVHAYCSQDRVCRFQAWVQILLIKPVHL